MLFHTCLHRLPHVLALACLATPAASYQEEKAEELPKPAALQRAFDRLKPDAQADIVEHYRLEMSLRRGFQLGFVRYIVNTQTADVDPGTWPSWEPAPFYDPELHAPAQPIPRKRINFDDPRSVKERARLLGDDADRELWPGWIYDWGTGVVRCLRDGKEVERGFHNALAGFPPELDLAEALLERWLDDGAEREAQAAFAHNYTDRSGHAFAGITLYDAWASGTDFETPDMDVLGLIHDLEDEWKRWKAPISPYKQKKLYEHVSEDLFLPAYHHRSLRTAMARIYLVGDADMRDGYHPNLDRFHALWEFHEASPDKLREDLPSARKWKTYLSKWVRKVDRDEELLQSGRNRRWALERDRQQAYATLVWVMRENDAIE